MHNIVREKNVPPIQKPSFIDIYIYIYIYTKQIIFVFTSIKKFGRIGPWFVYHLRFSKVRPLLKASCKST